MPQTQTHITEDTIKPFCLAQINLQVCTPLIWPDLGFEPASNHSDSVQ